MLNTFLTFNYELALVFLFLLSLFLSYSTQRHWALSNLSIRAYSSELCVLFAICLVFMLILYKGELSYYLYSSPGETFYSSRDFLTNPFVFFSKIFSILLTSFCLLLSSSMIRHSNFPRVEYPYFYLSALLAILLLISSNNLIYCYLALELLNFSLYLLLGAKVFSSLANEASQRYFIYSSYASALFLLALALLYGIFGTLNLSALAQLLEANLTLTPQHSMMLLHLAIIFLYGALLFKLSIFPFHFWVSEIYEGAPLTTILFFSTAPKLGYFTLFVKITFCLAVKLSFFLPLLQVLALISIGYGTIAGLYEYRLKRFLGYSTISNMGFVILALSLNTVLGFSAALVYFTVYLLTTAAFLGLLMGLSLETNLSKNNSTLESLEWTQLFSLQYYSKYPSYAIGLTITLLSFAGVPPLAGFFIKFYLLQACISSANVLLAFCVFLFSVLALAFYLRILRVLYVTPLQLSYEKKPLKTLFLSLRIQPLLTLFLLAFLLFFLVSYGIFFQNIIVLFFHWVALLLFSS